MTPSLRSSLVRCSLRVWLASLFVLAVLCPLTVEASASTDSARQASVDRDLDALPDTPEPRLEERSIAALLPALLFLGLGTGYLLFTWRRKRRLAPPASSPRPAAPRSSAPTIATSSLGVRHEQGAPSSVDGLQVEGSQPAVITVFTRTISSPHEETEEALWARDAALKAACPQCERQFGPSARFCPFDGSLLELSPTDEDELVEAEHFCPICSMLCELETTSCPIHQQASLPEEGRHHAEGLCRLCPSCTQRYDESLSYCPQDGDKLSLLN